MFAPLGEIIRNGIAQTTPSGLFFAIGEQLNALSGLALCLIMAWSHMDNPRRNGTLFMSIGLVWFLLCGVLCGTLGIPSLWTVIPTAPLVLLVLRWLTELPWRQLLLIVATASYMVAIVYYLSLVIDVAVLGADSTNLRVGWPGLVNLLLLDVVVLVSLWHPLHDSIPATFDSSHIRFPIHQQRLLAAYLAVSVRFVRDCGVVHAGGQFHAAGLAYAGNRVHRGGGLFLFHGVGVFPHLVHDSAVGLSARGPQATAL